MISISLIQEAAFLVACSEVSLNIKDNNVKHHCRISRKIVDSFKEIREERIRKNDRSSTEFL
jgi:hypothetical protein